MLKHKAPQNTESLQEPNDSKDEVKTEVEPPEAFPLHKEDNVSDTETIVGEKDDLCKEMKECLAKFATFALNSPENGEEEKEGKYPEAVSPPLQEMSPTTSEPTPLYQKSPQFVPNKALVDEKQEKEKEADNEKDPNVYKYVTFGLEIKKAMEECQNIINSYNSIKEKEKDDDGQLSLEQICEVMMSLDKNSAEFLDKIDSDDPNDINIANTKLAELVENMPQILANMPEIASKLSEFANASFELPEFASIMSNLPEVGNETQLTPETLKQIRELKLNKSRDNVKVTKNTTKRKTNRRVRNDSDIIGTMTFEFDSKDITDLIKDEKELQALMKSKTGNKEDFKDLLFCISAQVVINKVFEYLKQNKSPELAKCLEEDRNLCSLPKKFINSEMYTEASTLFDNSVKDALSMDELRELVRSRFNSWKHYVATKFKSIPIELLDNEIEAMLDKFYSYIQDLAGKQTSNDGDKIIEKIDELRIKAELDNDSDSDSCPGSKESLKQITKFLSTSAGHTFDLLIMRLSQMSQDKKSTVKGLKFQYIDVIKRCADSRALAGWILIDPEIAASVILELTGLPTKKPENIPDFRNLPNEKKCEYFMQRLQDMNRMFMETLPKKVLTGDEWLVMLYRLEQLEERLKESITKVSPPVKSTQTDVSEAELLAAKGLSKIIGQANVKTVKKTEPKVVKKEEKPNPVELKLVEDDTKCNHALFTKCEALLMSKGDKSLLDSFYAIKSHITQGLPLPETYKKHVISICSIMDANLLDEDLEDMNDDECIDIDKLTINPQNSEELAKYSAQALRDAKQTLNTVAFKNMARNGQSKSESDACDPKTMPCKWSADCICDVCSGAYASRQQKLPAQVDEAKKPVKPPKVNKCENQPHQQHVCKGMILSIFFISCSRLSL